MLDDLRKTIEATLGDLTPERAKSLAKGLAEPGAAKGQVTKSTADLIDWSQKNWDQIKGFVRREVSSQLSGVGVAAQTELDALKKRVRTLERTVEARGSASPKPAGKRTGTGTKAGAPKAGAPKAGTPKAGAPKAASASRKKPAGSQG